MKLSEMREMLSARGIQLTKSLGQNFLHDAHQLERIVAAAELTPTDKVLEIGPGLGPLTELLLARAGQVLAIEKDARLVEVLRQRLNAREGRVTRVPNPQDEPGLELAKPVPAGLELIHDDALASLRREPRDWSDWKLVANLPYSVASPILVELAQRPGRPVRMVVTLQLEVARRLMARAGEDDYGILTLLVQLDYEPRGWFKIPAGCFFPAPEVDSACVTLARRPAPMLSDPQRAAFVRIVKRAFSQRRKMMAKLLKAEWSAPDLERALLALAISPQARAEQLPLETFVRLAGLLSPATTDTTPP